MKSTLVASSVAIVLGCSINANAGTAGLTGIWTGTYTFAMFDQDNNQWDSSSPPQTWTWDFDAGTIDIANTSAFLATVWTAHDVTFIDNGGGAYGTTSASANLLFDWSVNINLPVSTEWDVAIIGSSALVTVNYATVFSSASAFPGFHPNFSGTLNQVVPIPAAVWLFGSGLIGLIGIARRKK